MSQLSATELLMRRIARKWFGAKFCTIETRSTHQLEITGRVSFALTCKCSSCGLPATYDPITGLTT